MIRSSVLALLGLMAAVFVGCASGIPPGAEEVRVAITGSELRLEPATVRAGDIYLVLDLPGSSIGFVQEQRTADGPPGPLSDDGLTRLASGGDAQGFYMDTLSDPGCAENRGRMGPPCGNVYQVVLGAGRYAFVLGMIEEGPPRSMAVLEVLP